jgi:hypothetical protein
MSKIYLKENHSLHLNLSIYPGQISPVLSTYDRILWEYQVLYFTSDLAIYQVLFNERIHAACYNVLCNRIFLLALTDYKILLSSQIFNGSPKASACSGCSSAFYSTAIRGLSAIVRTRSHSDP